MGYFTRTVADAMTAFTALTGKEIGAARRPLAVGVTGDLRCEPADPEMRDALERTRARLQGAGHTVETRTLPKFVRESYEHHRALVASEAAESHRES